MLDLRVFGTLDLTTGDAVTVNSVLSQAKRSALLVYLVLARPMGFQRRDTLLALFWPEFDEDHARNALNQSLYRLRQCLGAEVVETRGRQEVRIAEGLLRCDALAFEKALATGDPAHALELYRGDLLEGFHVAGAPDFEPWLARERIRFRNRARRAAVRLSEAATTLADARRWLERAREIAPDDEGIGRRLMEVLDRQGDRSGALRAYAVLAERLACTLGVEPSPKTQALAGDLRSRADWGAASARGANQAIEEPAARPAGRQAGEAVRDESRGRRRVLIATVTGAALLVALGWLVVSGSGGPAHRIERLAVLPLENLTNDPGQEYLVQGVHDRVISELQRVGVAVVARTSVLPYQERRQSVREIATELDVDAVIEGSVFRQGDSVSVGVRLVDGVTEESLWQRSFGGQLQQIAALHDDITRAIASEISAALDPGAERSRSGIRGIDPRAYEAYLNGVFHMRRITPEDLDMALEYFQTALEIDSTCAPALVGIARVWGMRNRVESVTSTEVLERTQPLLQHALALDSTLAEAYMVLGVTRTWFAAPPDHDGSEALLRRAVELSPGLAEARLILAQLLMILGRTEEAAEQARIGRSLDPRNPFAQVLFAQVLAFERRYAEAIEVLEAMLRKNPGAGGGRSILGGLYHLTGHYNKALGVTRDEYEALGAHDIVALLDRDYRKAGYAHAMAVIADTLAARAKPHDSGAIRIAALYVMAGEAEKALDWLEVAEATGRAGMIGVVPIWEELHDHPRFRAIALRLKVPILTPASIRSH